jgi:tight adherence protein B
LVRVSAALAFAAVASSCILLAALRQPPPRPTGLPRGSEPHAPSWVELAVTETGLAMHPSTAWMALRSAAAVAIALAAVLAGPAGGAITAAAVVAIPSIVRRTVDRRRADRRDAQLPEALERLASSLRAGHALGPAFVAMAAATPAPLGSELGAAAAEVNHGAGLAAALARWADRPAAGSEVHLAAAALGLAADAGGEVARSVDRVAATLQERRELRAEVRALATQARASAGVLAAAPLAFTGVVASVEPGSVAFLLTSPIGLICLVGGLGLEALGAAWMARILRSVAG